MKTATQYGVYNTYGDLVVVRRLRGHALGYCRIHVGDDPVSGNSWKKYFKIIKVDIIPHVQSNAE